MTPLQTRELIENSSDSDQTVVGRRTSQLGVHEDIGIHDPDRVKHTLSAGPTGTGKTQTAVHAALQDSHKNRGFCFINPKGNAIDEIIAKLPENRLNDVIYINPASSPLPGINVLQPYTTPRMNEAQRENQKEIIVSDLIDLFKRYSQNWGDQFGRVLETLLRAHLTLNIQRSESNTLADVYQCVTNPDTLKQLINATHDPVTRDHLIQVQDDLSSYELGPLQRRLNDFMENTVIRKIISAETSSINFRHILNQGQILLVDIQKGEVGETVSHLIGSIILTQIWAAAQSRITQPPETREPYYLYVDELQNFAGEGSNFTKILGEAREYRLGCWLITQYIHQLPQKMRRAIINNCRTKIIFEPRNTENLPQITQMLPGLNKQTLQQLNGYRAAFHTPQRQTATTIDTLSPWKPERTPETIEQIKEAAQPETTDGRVELETSHGSGANAGGETHRRLLEDAKKELENRGFQVDLLYQNEGSDIPDGHVHLPNDNLAHLEAENSTLDKPGKVLKNLQRAIKQDRQVIFAVEPSNRKKLENILTDPVNRQGNDHTDEQGTYTHYLNNNGQPITNLDLIEDAEHQIIEIPLDDESDPKPTEECPELKNIPQNDLEKFCIYRDDGYCTELETDCVLNEVPADD